MGAVFAGAGAAVDVAKKVVSGKMQKAMRTGVVNQELGLDEKIKALREING